VRELGARDDGKTTTALFRVSLVGGVRAALVFFAGLGTLVAIAAGPSSCANGGLAGGPSGDGGDDSTVDGAPVEGGKDGGGGEASAASFAKACSDNATSYCTQLSTCYPFLLSVQYGDMPTCETQLAPAYCLDIVTAKGSGWTPAGLEACIAARQKLSCQDFLYLKPQPAACRPTGTLSSGGCRYDSQCGTGYCSIPPASVCGNCVQLGNVGAVCASYADCDGNLMCSGMNRCAAPAPVGGGCDPMTTPCQNGLFCNNGKCEVAGAANAPCDPDSGIGCDYNQGVYCATGTCSAITVGMANSTCGSPPPPTVCAGDGTCSGGFCTPPVTDGQPCDGGINCTYPSTCNGGTCGLFSASQCH
jgi:hypothetical protein